VPAVKAAPPPPEDEEEPTPKLIIVIDDEEEAGSTSVIDTSERCGSCTVGDEGRSVDEPPSSSKKFELDTTWTLDVSEPSSEEEWPPTNGLLVPNKLSASTNSTTLSSEPGEARGSAFETEGVPMLSPVPFLLVLRRFISLNLKTNPGPVTY
jgi:hypothetical protein